MIPVLNLQSVSVVRDGKTILGPLDWQVNENERWVILGPNGAGKSTLFSLCSAQIHPTSGIYSKLDPESDSWVQLL